MKTFPTRARRARILLPLVTAAASLSAAACGEDTPSPADAGTSGSPLDSGLLSDSGATPTPEASVQDGSTADSSTGTSDASSTGSDVGDSGQASPQTAFGSCEGEPLLRDYPVKVSATGLSAADGTKVYGWVTFGLDYDFCSVLGETQVQGGAFTLNVTATSDGGYFPDVAFWIDGNGDGVCDPNGEVVFRSASSRGATSLDLELTSEDIADDFFNDAIDTACEPFDMFVGG